MEHISHVPKNQQRLFNYCRLYLNVEFSSELFTHDKKRIRTAVWNGLIPTPLVKGSMTRPLVTPPRPSHKAWQAWRTNLTNLWNVTSTGIVTRSTPLIANPFTPHWVWFFNVRECRVYLQFKDNRTQLYTPASSIRRCSARLNKVFRFHYYRHQNAWIIPIVSQSQSLGL